MPTHRNLLPCLLLPLVLCAFAGLTGCSSLRFAPSESQRQIAFNTYQNAAVIAEKGAEPASPAAVQVLEGAATALAYTGMPAEPEITDYPQVLEAAQADSTKRPDIADIAEPIDAGLSLAAELAILFGAGGVGVAGKKLTDWIKLAREKNQALSEIIAGNELFKKSADPTVVKAFYTAQSDKQSPATETLVTQLKS